MFACVFYLTFALPSLLVHFTESNVKCSSLLSANMQSKPRPPSMLELYKFYQQRGKYMWNGDQRTEDGQNAYLPDEKVVFHESTVQYGRRAGSIKKTSSQNVLWETTPNQREVTQKKAQPMQETSKQAAISEVIPHGSRKPTVNDPRWKTILPTLGQPVRETTSAPTQQTLRQPTRETKRELIQITPGQASSNTWEGWRNWEANGKVLNPQTAGQPEREMKFPPVRDSSGQEAREKRFVRTQQTSGQDVNKTRLVSAQQTSEYPAEKKRSRPTKHGWSTVDEEMRTALFQHTMSQRKLPPIQQTSGLHQTARKAPIKHITSKTKLPPIPQTSGPSQTEGKAREIKQAARACHQLTTNEQCPESQEGSRKIRRHGRQEVCEAGGEGRRRRQGVCKQTDGTEAERTFVRVLNKRF